MQIHSLLNECISYKWHICHNISTHISDIYQRRSFNIVQANLKQTQIIVTKSAILALLTRLFWELEEWNTTNIIFTCLGCFMLGRTLMDCLKTNVKYIIFFICQGQIKMIWIIIFHLSNISSNLKLYPISDFR